MQRAAPRPTAANPNLLICLLLFIPPFLLFLLLGWIRRAILCDRCPAKRAAVHRGKRHSSTESNAPRCRPPSGRVALPAARGGSGCSSGPRSGSADETRNPSVG